MGLKNIQIRNNSYLKDLDINLTKQSSKDIFKAVVFVCDNIQTKEELLKELSNIKDKEDVVIVDTPEKDLHPKDQLKLYEKLIDENQKDQLIIFTSSENVVDAILIDEDAIVLKMSANGVESISRADFVLPEVTYGEIQYLVFNIYSKDYHNQLYGRIAKLLEKHVLEWERAHHGDVEDLVIRYEKTPGEYDNPYGYKRNNRIEKLPTYIRNAIYYPENKDRKYTEEDLIKSTDLMRKILIGANKEWYNSYLGKLD